MLEHVHWLATVVISVSHAHSFFHRISFSTELSMELSSPPHSRVTDPQCTLVHTDINLIYETEQGKPPHEGVDARNRYYWSRPADWFSTGSLS